MMFSRGAPTIYYGDEQGFAGDGGYGGARQDMFETRVAAYRDDRIIGGAEEPDFKLTIARKPPAPSAK
jgi:glycosidase